MAACSTSPTYFAAIQIRFVTRGGQGIKATHDFINHNPIRFPSFLPDLNYTAPWYGLL